MNVFLLRPNYALDPSMVMRRVAVPLGLGYLSSVLKKAGYQVKIIDGLSLNLSNKEIAKMCNGAEIVGVTSMSNFSSAANDLCQEMKAAGYTVVIGGMHPSMFPEETLLKSGADFLIAGEGEETFLKLLESLSRGESPPSKIISSSRIIDVDSLPFPDWEQMLSLEYFPSYSKKATLSSATIISSRGCGCTINRCPTYQMWQDKIFYRSPGNIMQEIDYLKEKFGIEEVYFADENISINGSYLHDISCLIQKRGVRWKIAAPVRPKTINKEMAQTLKEAGCTGLLVGTYPCEQVDLDVHLGALINLAEVGIPPEVIIGVTTPGRSDEFINEFLFFVHKLPPKSSVFLSINSSLEEKKNINEFVNKIQSQIPAGINIKFEIL